MLDASEGLGQGRDVGSSGSGKCCACRPPLCFSSQVNSYCAGADPRVVTAGSGRAVRPDVGYTGADGPVSDADSAGHEEVSSVPGSNCNVNFILVGPPRDIPVGYRPRRDNNKSGEGVPQEKDKGKIETSHAFLRNKSDKVQFSNKRLREELGLPEVIAHKLTTAGNSKTGSGPALRGPKLAVPARPAVGSQAHRLSRGMGPVRGGGMGHHIVMGKRNVLNWGNTGINPNGFVPFGKGAPHMAQQSMAHAWKPAGAGRVPTARVNFASQNNHAYPHTFGRGSPQFRNAFPQTVPNAHSFGNAWLCGVPSANGYGTNLPCGKGNGAGKGKFGGHLYRKCWGCDQYGHEHHECPQGRQGKRTRREPVKVYNVYLGC